jgi:hypothetical protein
VISSFEAGNNTKLDSVPELLRNNSKEVIANFLEKYVYNTIELEIKKEEESHDD